MDFAPPYVPSPRTYERCTTPTPSGRRRSVSDSETPRQIHGTGTALSDVADDKDEEDDDFENSCYGFTMSYLRRVPVLAEMARAVVRAERKRRDREARQREKVGTKSQATATRASSSSKPTASSKIMSSSAKIGRAHV